MSAFPGQTYSRSRCSRQMDIDMANKVPAGRTRIDGEPAPVIQYCRACELACPVGA